MAASERQTAAPRIAIAAAGTGGHIYPGLAVAQALRMLEPNVEVWFLTTRRGLGPDILAQHGERFVVTPGKPAPQAFPWGMGAFAMALARGSLMARRELGRQRVQALLATGGYGCVPAVAAARSLRLPVVWQEQNAIPGRATRLLARWTWVVALGFEEAAGRLPGAVQNRLRVTGNPVRPDVVRADRAAAQRKLALNPSKKTVLVVGASQGARRFNRALAEAAGRLGTLRQAQVLASTGRGQFEETARLIRERWHEAVVGEGRVQVGGLRVVPYLDDMPAAVAAADLAVSRAGAISLAEFTARGVPLVLVPYPHALDAHQDANARVLERAGAAVVVPDAELTADRLVELLVSLLGEPGRLSTMAEASRSLGRPEAAVEVARLLLEAASGTGSAVRGA
ncbi:MAG: UDP-N-acetylglucosamine--N-acetylmuramyl-(pentapeptide) pyrophosphoryl-undecaprenol N-acetylglucosamine transferase [Bacillota bacterium]